jgi:DNA invertase Pin-like site-specific DNA recombinase
MLTANLISDLRMSADKAKMEGRFDAGERLHELLDAFEDQETSATVRDDVESDRDDVESDRDRLEEALQEIEKLASKAGAYSASRVHVPDVDDMDVIDLRAEVTKLRKALEDIHDLANP